MTFIAQLGLLREHDVVNGAVVRKLEPYPVYGRGYQDGLA